MAAPPYMKLYVADYLADTTHLTRAQHGAYMLLLLAMWRAGGKLPATDAKLAQIARCSPKEWASERETLLAFFQRRGGQITHKRLAEEMAKADHVSGVRKQAANRGVAKKRSKNNDDASPNGSPNGDQLGPYIRHQSQKKKPPKPPEGAFSDPVFDQALAAYPESGRATTDPAKARSAWALVVAEVSAEAVLAAVRAFAEFVRSEGDQAKRPPSFHVWLAGRRWEVYLRAEPSTPSWSGPAWLWQAMVDDRELGEAFAKSWLVACTFQQVPVQALVTASPMAFRRLSERAGGFLARHGLELLERAA